MPKNVPGGGQPGPAAPGSAAVPDATYSLSVPVATDIADVPASMETLATNVARELDLRLTEVSAARAYQGKIVVRTTRPTTPADYPDGTIIFVVGG